MELSSYWHSNRIIYKKFKLLLDNHFKSVIFMTDSRFFCPHTYPSPHHHHHNNHHHHHHHCFNVLISTIALFFIFISCATLSPSFSLLWYDKTYIYKIWYKYIYIYIYTRNYIIDLQLHTDYKKLWRNFLFDIALMMQ